MLKRIVVLCLVLSFLSVPLCFANDQHTQILRQTALNSITDYFAMIGKSHNEKKLIKQKRKKLRQNIRLKSLNDKKRKKALKEIEKSSRKREELRKIKRRKN